MNAPRVFYRGEREEEEVEKAMTERRDFVLFAFLERRSAGQHFPSCGGGFSPHHHHHPFTSFSTCNAKIERETEFLLLLHIISLIQKVLALRSNGQGYFASGLNIF